MFCCSADGFLGKSLVDAISCHGDKNTAPPTRWGWGQTMRCWVKPAGLNGRLSKLQSAWPFCSTHEACWSRVQLWCWRSSGRPSIWRTRADSYRMSELVFLWGPSQGYKGLNCWRTVEFPVAAAAAACHVFSLQETECDEETTPLRRRREFPRRQQHPSGSQRWLTRNTISLFFLSLN